MAIVSPEIKIQEPVSGVSFEEKNLEFPKLLTGILNGNDVRRTMIFGAHSVPPMTRLEIFARLTSTVDAARTKRVLGLMNGSITPENSEEQQVLTWLDAQIAYHSARMILQSE